MWTHSVTGRPRGMVQMMFFFSFGSSCSVLPVHAFINISKNEKHIINNKPLNMQQLRCSFYKEIPKGKKKNGREKRKCRHKVEGVIPSRLHLFCINSPQSSHHNPASRNVQQSLSWLCKIWTKCHCAFAHAKKGTLSNKRIQHASESKKYVVSFTSTVPTTLRLDSRQTFLPFQI